MSEPSPRVAHIASALGWILAGGNQPYYISGGDGWSVSFSEIEILLDIPKEDIPRMLVTRVEELDIIGELRVYMTVSDDMAKRFAKSVVFPVLEWRLKQ